MFDVKAHMIVRETETAGAAQSWLSPLARGTDWLVLSVQRHPVVSLLVLALLIYAVWRWAYK